MVDDSVTDYYNISVYNARGTWQKVLIHIDTIKLCTTGHAHGRRGSLRLRRVQDDEFDVQNVARRSLQIITFVDDNRCHFTCIINQRQRKMSLMIEERKLQIFTDFRQKEGENRSIINQRQRKLLVRKKRKVTDLYRFRCRKNQKSQYNRSRDNEDSEDSQSCSASH